MSRAVALFLVAPFLTLASALAPQHVHEAGAGHDRQVVAHSHFDPHHLDIHESDETEIEHDIEHVVWLESAILQQAPYRTLPLPVAMPVSYEVVPAGMPWSVTTCDAAARVHGPPKPVQRFRGPPLFLV